jgi:lactate dehydrogenase-like 2-hydroxyacid dehydrogenase
VGIIGLGDIGSRVARILYAIGASILVHDPYVEDDKIARINSKRHPTVRTKQKPPEEFKQSLSLLSVIERKRGREFYDLRRLAASAS